MLTKAAKSPEEILRPSNWMAFVFQFIFSMTFQKKASKFRASAESHWISKHVFVVLLFRLFIKRNLPHAPSHIMCDEYAHRNVCSPASSSTDEICIIIPCLHWSTELALETETETLVILNLILACSFSTCYTSTHNSLFGRAFFWLFFREYICNFCLRIISPFETASLLNVPDGDGVERALKL